MTNEEIGNAAVNGAELPATDGAENPYPDRVDDVEKAHVMALEGDKLRTSARRQRWMAEGAKSKEYDSNPWSRGAPSRAESLSSAERDDAQASAIEEWAGVLHDHPVSEAYKEQHPDVSFTPEGLTREETWILIRKIEGLEGVKLWQSALEDESRIDKVLPQALDRWGGRVSRKILKNPHTTLGELRTHLIEAVNIEIQKELADVNDTKSVLDDVLSGRASQPTEPTETQQAA